MATQPQRDNLLTLLNENLESNLEVIADNQVSIVEIQPVIDDFTPSCVGFDTKILSLTTEINTLKSEVVTLHSSAYAVGCGTTAGQTKMRPDTTVNNKYNLCDASYDGDDPYDVVSATLSISNVGVGTFIVYTPNNSSASGLGILYADIGSCYGPGCVSGNCTNFANQINTKQNQITILQSELSELVGAINIIKDQRSDYEVRRWGDKYSIRTLTEENNQIRLALGILVNPAYDSYT